MRTTPDKLALQVWTTHPDAHKSSATEALPLKDRPGARSVMAVSSIRALPNGAASPAHEAKICENDVIVGVSDRRR